MANSPKIIWKMMKIYWNDKWCLTLAQVQKIILHTNNILMSTLKLNFWIANWTFKRVGSQNLYTQFLFSEFVQNIIFKRPGKILDEWNFQRNLSETFWYWRFWISYKMELYYLHTCTPHTHTYTPYIFAGNLWGFVYHYYVYIISVC